VEKSATAIAAPIRSARMLSFLLPPAQFGKGQRPDAIGRIGLGLKYYGN
jgi:hypothetical protein